MILPEKYRGARIEESRDFGENRNSRWTRILDTSKRFGCTQARGRDGAEETAED